ncbi:MAG TPA: hypothetical protein VF903_07615 [Nitrospirota bacterium]
MKNLANIIIHVILAIAFLLVGFAAGLPIGQSMGFSTGTEWALVQAGIVAREAGVFMPVNFEEGQFRVILRQPGQIYKRAWRLADMHEDEDMVCEDRDRNEIALAASPEHDESEETGDRSSLP